MPNTPVPPAPPKRTSSGEHHSVKAMREKFESIAEHTVPQTEALNARVDKLSDQVASHPPPDSDPDSVPDTEPECTCSVVLVDLGPVPCPVHTPKKEDQP